MKLISLKQAEKILKRTIKAPIQQEIIFLTKKKDRSLTLKVDLNSYTLIEKGYCNQVVRLDFGNSKDKRLVSLAFKREFPRSHWVYVIEKR